MTILDERTGEYACLSLLSEIIMKEKKRKEKLKLKKKTKLCTYLAINNRNKVE